jgi:hypothetical protein
MRTENSFGSNLIATLGIGDLIETTPQKWGASRSLVIAIRIQIQ